MKKTALWFGSMVMAATMGAGLSTAVGAYSGEKAGASTSVSLRALVRTASASGLEGWAKCPAGWIASGGGVDAGTFLPPQPFIAQAEPVQGFVGNLWEPTGFSVVLEPSSSTSTRLPAGAKSFVICLHLG